MSVFKTTITQHWLDGRKVPAGTPGAKKVTKKSKKYHGRVPGDRKLVPLCTNKVAAQQMLADLVKAAEMGMAGMGDKYKAHRTRPLARHLDDCRAVLASQGGTDKNVDMKLSQVRRVFDACGFALIGDISKSAVEAALAEMRKEPRFGLQTSNHYLASVKQFARWLVKDGRSADNPLAHIARHNVKLDRRHDRRDLSEEEMARLLGAASLGKAYRKTSGPDREMLYLVASLTGLRASELASLERGSFDLDAPVPAVTVEAAYSKHRRPDTIPLHPDLVSRLRGWFEGRGPGRLWPGKWAEHNEAGDMLKRDMASARAAWLAEAGGDAERERRAGSDFLLFRDHAGRVADFHSLRHTFITSVVDSGASPKEAQTLARHSTITLTMDRYAHCDLEDSARVVRAMPPIPAPARCVPGCVPAGDTDRGGVRLPETPEGSTGGRVVESEGLAVIADETNRDGVRLDERSTPDRTRTCNLRFRRL